MFVIVEGIDGSGKSTIIDYLAQQYHLDDLRLYDMWFNKYQKDKFGFFKDMFEKYKNNNVIFHRYHISQSVYDESLRNHRHYDITNVEAVIFGEDINKVVLINVDLDAREAEDRIMKRDNSEERQDLYIERRLFLKRFYETSILNKICVYNFNIDIVKGQLNCFMEFLKNSKI